MKKNTGKQGNAWENTGKYRKTGKLLSIFRIIMKDIMKSFMINLPRRGWTAVCKDSREQFPPFTIEKSHLATDRERHSWPQ